MVHDLLTKPIRIQLGNPKDGLVANEDVTQHLVLLRSVEEKDFVLVFAEFAFGQVQCILTG